MQNKSKVPCFFLLTGRYTLGTPRGVAFSDRTIDMFFDEFFCDANLQRKLRLASSMYAGKPGSFPRAFTASYLSSFASDREEQERRRNYLENNGVIRVLITDDRLQEEVRRI